MHAVITRRPCLAFASGLASECLAVLTNFGIRELSNYGTHIVVAHACCSSLALMPAVGPHVLVILMSRWRLSSYCRGSIAVGLFKPPFGNAHWWPPEVRFTATPLLLCRFTVSTGSPLGATFTEGFAASRSVAYRTWRSDGSSFPFVSVAGLYCFLTERVAVRHTLSVCWGLLVILMNAGYHSLRNAASFVKRLVDRGWLPVASTSAV